MHLFEDFQHTYMGRAARATAGKDEADAQTMRRAPGGADLHACVSVRWSLRNGDDGRREPLQCEK
jgi:hypothetical protein